MKTYAFLVAALLVSFTGRAQVTVEFNNYFHPGWKYFLTRSDTVVLKANFDSSSVAVLERTEARGLDKPHTTVTVLSMVVNDGKLHNDSYPITIDVTRAENLYDAPVGLAGTRVIGESLLNQRPVMTRTTNGSDTGAVHFFNKLWVDQAFENRTYRIGDSSVRAIPTDVKIVGGVLHTITYFTQTLQSVNGRMARFSVRMKIVMGPFDKPLPYTLTTQGVGTGNFEYDTHLHYIRDWRIRYTVYQRMVQGDMIMRSVSVMNEDQTCKLVPMD